jgi:hypothetical protein
MHKFSPRDKIDSIYISILLPSSFLVRNSNVYTFEIDFFFGKV